MPQSHLACAELQVSLSTHYVYFLLTDPATSAAPDVVQIYRAGYAHQKQLSEPLIEPSNPDAHTGLATGNV